MRVSHHGPLPASRPGARPLLLALAALLQSSCEQPTQRRGSEACQSWQDALCAYSSDRCGTVQRQECESTAHSIECRRDSLARDCAAALDEASCSTPPDACDIDDVADRRAAADACARLLDARCQAFHTCDDALQRCADAASELPCAEAIGVAPNYGDCMTTLPNLACGSPIPAVCDGAVLLHAPATNGEPP